MGESTGDTGVSRVLLVEDEYAAARLVELAFEEVDETIQFAAVPDGEAALDRLRGSIDEGGPLPDIMILDLDLPGMQGTEVLREINATDALTEIPVVMFSSNSDQEAIDRCYSLGASTYFVKPEDYAGIIEFAIEVRTYWGAAALPSSAV